VYNTEWLKSFLPESTVNIRRIITDI